MSKSRKAKVVNTRSAGDDCAVHAVVGGDGTRYQRQPCAQCPWRVDQTGAFPAQAFEHSAPTSYDAAMESFSCHMAGLVEPSTCAGFLLRNSANNIVVRLALADGRIDMAQVSDGGHELYGSYREMAEANGVDTDSPVLARCRADDE
jgi:hypothetical protein